MKHFLRNILIALFSVTGVTFLYRARMRKKGPLVRVVVFHDVTDADWFFKSVTLFVKKYHVLTPQEFIERKFNPEKINILITFDDGYASWVTTCLPILRKLQCRGVFFLNSGLPDIVQDENARLNFVRENLKLQTSRKTISWEEVRLLCESGHTLGGHTKTHRRLSELQEEVQKAEITEDKKRIETMLGTQVSLFAYPFGNVGDFIPQSALCAQKAGYTHVFSTESGFVDTTSGNFNIPRICLEDNGADSVLTRWVEGGHDLYTKIKYLCVR